MILFFDRNIGKSIPQALLHLRLPAPVSVEYHDKHFGQGTPDDQWLTVVGGRDWIVISHDSKFHRMPMELVALKQYNVGASYLWGARATNWETFRAFARAYDRIVAAADTTPKPFVYRVLKSGRLVHTFLCPEPSRRDGQEW